MNDIKLSKLPLRVLLYCIGLLFLSLGSVIASNSDLGVSPVMSLPFVISRIVGMTPGTCIVAVFVVYIFLQIPLRGKDFHPIQFTQIIFSTIYGVFVDMIRPIIGDFAIPTYFGRLLMLAISIVCVALGLFFYMEAELVLMPMEGLAHAMADFFHMPFSTAKTLADCVSVLLGVALSLVFLGELYGIREGTIIAALLSGKVVGVFKRRFSQKVQAFCFPESAA